MWAGCSSKSFQDIQSLYKHVKEHTVFLSLMPVQHQWIMYVCMWEHCRKKFNKKLLQNHIFGHTGGLQDQFFEILLKTKPRHLPHPQEKWDGTGS